MGYAMVLAYAIVGAFVNPFIVAFLRSRGGDTGALARSGHRAPYGLKYLDERLD